MSINIRALYGALHMACVRDARRLGDMPVGLHRKGLVGRALSTAPGAGKTGRFGLDRAVRLVRWIRLGWLGRMAITAGHDDASYCGQTDELKLIHIHLLSVGLAIPLDDHAIRRALTPPPTISEVREVL